MAEPTTTSILALMDGQAFTSDALANRFDLSRQAVSKQIMVLQKVEWVKPTQSGREIYHFFNPKDIRIALLAGRIHESVRNSF